MIRASYGAIVEGEYDVGVFEVLIPKICPYPSEVWAQEARGRARLMSRFAQMLRMFEHRTASAGPVDRALVIRDSNGKNPALVENEMQLRIAHQGYAFPHGVQVHALQQETETWLLADAAAISRVAGQPAHPPPGPLEQRHQAKEAFTDVLYEVGLQYTPAICRRISMEIDLDTLRAACPSFAIFEQKVRLPHLA